MFVASSSCSKALHACKTFTMVRSTSQDHYAGFGWGRVDFLHSSSYEAMFWVCARNGADNTGMFSLLLSSAYTASTPFLPLAPPYQQGGGDAQEVGRRHS